MASGSQLQIAVLPGDGIGVEVMDACLRVLDALPGTGKRACAGHKRSQGSSYTARGPSASIAGRGT